jgi:tetratricopeptide (TPR) repeat protein
MKKSAIILFVAALFSLNAMAQTVQEGVNHLYAQRYQSAKGVFEKLTAANPNNLEAIYWLGQTLIDKDDVAGAKALYSRTLSANGNAPWALVGMGHVNIIEGKAAEARAQFDQAITLSKGKKGNDPLILNAVGRANVQPYSEKKRLGDLDYAITKLNEAAQAAPTNPDIFVTLGNAYRKKQIGGEAVVSYRKAGTYAPAFYRLAMLWSSQRNWELMIENLNSAIAADPRFAPALYELYYYELLRKQNFDAAAALAEKYKAVADPSIENEYLTAQTLQVKKDYAGAIASANKIVNGLPNPNPRVYRLLAYAYLGAKDTANACTNSNLFLSKAHGEDVISQDYLLHATACGKGNPEMIRNDIIIAVKMDSVLSRQMETLNEATKEAKANNYKLLEGELGVISYELRQAAGRTMNVGELISFIAVPLYLGGNYVKADSIARVYAAAAPDSIHGYYWSALSLTAMDTTEPQQGLAMADWEKVLTIAEKDTVRFKSQGIRSATSLAVFTYNVKADKAAALAYVNRGLAFESTNANLLNIQKALQGTKQQPKQPAKTDPKTKTSGGGGGGGTTKTKAKK